MSSIVQQRNPQTYRFLTCNETSPQHGSVSFGNIFYGVLFHFFKKSIPQIVDQGPTRKDNFTIERKIIFVFCAAHFSNIPCDRFSCNKREFLLIEKFFISNVKVGILDSFLPREQKPAQCKILCEVRLFFYSRFLVGYHIFSFSLFSSFGITPWQFTVSHALDVLVT